MRRNIYQNEITYDKENDELEIKTCYARKQYEEYMRHVFFMYLRYRMTSKDPIFVKDKHALHLPWMRLLMIIAFFLSAHIVYQEYQLFSSLNIFDLMMLILTGVFSLFFNKFCLLVARLFVHSPLFHYQRSVRPELREMSLYYSRFLLFMQSVIISRGSRSCNYVRSGEIFISENNQTEYRMIQRDNGVYFFRFVSASPQKKQIDWKSSFALMKSQYSEGDWQLLVRHLARMCDLC